MVPDWYSYASSIQLYHNTVGRDVVNQLWWRLCSLYQSQWYHAVIKHVLFIRCALIYRATLSKLLITFYITDSHESTKLFGVDNEYTVRTSITERYFLCSLIFSIFHQVKPKKIASTNTRPHQTINHIIWSICNTTSINDYN